MSCELEEIEELDESADIEFTDVKCCDDLSDINTSSLFKKLEGIYRSDDLIASIQLINIVSSKPQRDKNLISAFDSSEIEIRLYTNESGYKRNIRFFTKKGLSRYLHSGKIFDYINVCKYFEIQPIDKTTQQFEYDLSKMEIIIPKKNRIKSSPSKLYKTSSLILWLYGKRKVHKSLSYSTTISDFIICINEFLPSDYSIPKYQYLRSLLVTAIP